ncbi:hypothetical protein SAMN05421771_0618 [Granulicella pectinivorans]|uniref:Uncharacterized protein n=1 Tax=Granulicella pectinivorans TaxID=474950 RepID=A0A1I6LEV1_9BACT|nr:hypothetical protein [Granulicella pectinivorans]SFS01810.1 hypothetical protein SAMN05421771_0618 [Granulicella pectinivorans]
MPDRWRKPRRRSLRSVMATCMLGGAVVLAVPYFVPVPPSVGDSYALGFSNKAAWMLFLAFAAVFCWWRGEIEPDAGTMEMAPLGRKQLLWALGLTLVTQVALWWYGARFGPQFEAPYLMDRLGHLAEGRKVFADFEFAYGAGLLYVPLWLSRGLKVSLLNGYLLSLVLENLLGVAMFWAVAKELARGSRHARAIFWLVYGTMFVWAILFGAQYTPMRYWMGPWLAMSIYRLGLERGRYAAALCVALASVGLLLFVSPEQGVALLAGTLLFGALFLHGRRVWLGLVLVGLGGVGMVWELYRLGGLDTAMAMASGGYGVPVTPAPYLVPGIGLMLAAGCMLVEAVRRRAQGSIGLYVVCCGVFCVPAAFGRFDVIHFLANLSAVTLVGWFAVARKERYWWWAWRGYAGLALTLLAPTAVIGAWWLGSQWVKAEQHPLPVVRPEGPRMYAPFGEIAPWPDGRIARVDTGRFYGLENVMNPQQVREKVEELRGQGQAPIVTVDRSCVAHSTRLGVMHVTYGLYAKAPLRESHTMDPICDELRTHYEPVSGGQLPGGFKIVVRKP